MDILNAFVAILNYIIVPATAYGAQLALGALGVTLIYGILRFSNFAHGDTMAFGTGLTILVTWGLQSAGISFGPLPTALLALPFGIALTAAMVLATDKVVYSYYRKVRAAPIYITMVSVGVMFVMNGLTRVLIGVDEIKFADGARFLISAADFKAATGLSEALAIRGSTAITVMIAANSCL